MSTAFNMRLMPDGVAALWNAKNTGVLATLTHIQLGTGHKPLTDQEVSLAAPVQVTSIGSGSRPSPRQIRIAGVFPGIANYDFSEVGIFIGHPSAGGKLFAYYVVETGKIGTMVQGTDFVFSHEWTMAASDAAFITIVADAGQSSMLSMMAAHEGAADPHPQYATEAYLLTLAADLLKKNEINFSAVANGFLVFPPDASGKRCIWQWGTYSPGASGIFTVNLPTTFPNAGLYVNGSWGGASAMPVGMDDSSCSAAFINAGQISLTIDNGTPTRFFAIGF